MALCFFACSRGSFVTYSTNPPMEAAGARLACSNNRIFELAPPRPLQCQNHVAPHSSPSLCEIPFRPTAPARMRLYVSSALPVSFASALIRSQSDSLSLANTPPQY
eukprot:6172978-Pleurochrysis_carterae.AAC.2